MIKSKNNNTSYLDYIRIQTLDNIKFITAIFYWKHASGRDAHCLMRVYIRPDHSCTILLSAMRFSYDYQPFYEFLDLVNELSPILKETFEITPEKAHWISHYGNFSQYEHELVPDSFFHAYLIFDEGICIEEDDSRYAGIPREEIRKYIPFDLEPGAQLIEELGWGKYPMGWE